MQGVWDQLCVLYAAVLAAAVVLPNASSTESNVSAVCYAGRDDEHSSSGLSSFKTV